MQTGIEQIKGDDPQAQHHGQDQIRHRPKLLHRFGAVCVVDFGIVHCCRWDGLTGRKQRKKRPEQERNPLSSEPAASGKWLSMAKRLVSSASANNGPRMKRQMKLGRCLSNMACSSVISADDRWASKRLEGHKAGSAPKTLNLGEDGRVPAHTNS